jgi:translation initiation factor 3 subunit M
VSNIYPPEVIVIFNHTEIEGFYNLLFAHTFSLYPPTSPEAKQYITNLLKTISASPSERLSVKYRMYVHNLPGGLETFTEHVDSVSNLFNTIPRNSPLRLTVYQTLIQIATSKDDLDVLELTKSDVEKWLSEWEISPEEKSAFLKSIVDAYVKAEQPYVLLINLAHTGCITNFLQNDRL